MSYIFSEGIFRMVLQNCSVKNNLYYTEFYIQRVLRFLPKTTLPISRWASFFVEKTMEEILISFIYSIFFNICTFAFMLPLRRVSISDLDPSKLVAKLLQRLSTLGDKQQPLSVYRRNTEIQDRFYFEHKCSIANHGTSQ